MRDLSSGAYIGYGPAALVTTAKPISGVDVVVTIFGDFWQVSAKQLAFFIENQCYGQFFA
jgi:hypothetical protein